MYGDEARRTEKYRPGQGVQLPLGVLACVQQQRIGDLAGCEVWGIDGEVVRNPSGIGDDEFEGGGNYARHLYIPRPQIWVEFCLPLDAWPPLILHEWVEQHAMTVMGIPYEQAHTICARLCERVFRAGDKDRFKCASMQDVLALAAKELPTCLSMI